MIGNFVKKTAKNYNKVSMQVKKHEVFLKIKGGVIATILTYKYFRADQEIKNRQLNLTEESNEIRRESNLIKLKQIELVKEDKKYKLVEETKADLQKEFGINDILKVNDQIINIDELDDVSLSAEDVENDD